MYCREDTSSPCRRLAPSVVFDFRRAICVVARCQEHGVCRHFSPVKILVPSGLRPGPKTLSRTKKSASAGQATKRLRNRVRECFGGARELLQARLYGTFQAPTSRRFHISPLSPPGSRIQPSSSPFRLGGPMPAY